MDWIKLAEDGVQLQDLMKTAMEMENALKKSMVWTKCLESRICFVH